MFLCGKQLCTRSWAGTKGCRGAADGRRFKGAGSARVQEPGVQGFGADGAGAQRVQGRRGCSGAESAGAQTVQGHMGAEAEGCRDVGTQGRRGKRAVVNGRG